MSANSNSQIVSAVRAELVALAAERDTLTPHCVLDRARDPTSPLHPYFEWDDGEAAEKFRLMQASVLIRQCRVRVIAADGQKTSVVRAFVSLPGDRIAGAGYRTIESVLATEPRRAELLAMAFGELTAFKRKYETLHELADVFASIDRTLDGVAQAKVG